MAASAGRDMHQVLKEKERILQEKVDEFRTNQKDIQKTVMARKQLDGQLTENQNVKDELDLADGNVVYKLIGPILVKQELSESKQNVDKRLEYITKELRLGKSHQLQDSYSNLVPSLKSMLPNTKEKTDKTYKDLEQKQEDLADKLSKLQQDYQQTMVKAGVVR